MEGAGKVHTAQVCFLLSRLPVRFCAEEAERGHECWAHELSLSEGNHRETIPPLFCPVLEVSPLDMDLRKVCVQGHHFHGHHDLAAGRHRAPEPLHLSCFPRARALPSPFPPPAASEKKCPQRARPGLVFLAGGVVNSRGPREKREGGASVCPSSG